MQLSSEYRHPVSGILVTLLFALCLAVPARAEDLGPTVGTTAPSIGTPLDQTGKSRSLTDLTGERGLVLLFFRSAAWCPYCQAQLIDVNSGAAEIEKRGYKIAALSYDTPDKLSAFADKHQITYTFLSDPKSEVIDRYNLRDPQYPPSSFAYGVPRPIIFILDAKGVVKAKLFEATFKTRPPVSAVIEKLDQVNGSG